MRAVHRSPGYIAEIEGASRCRPLYLIMTVIMYWCRRD
jgi:hypothetical protein